jgi:hypothetical protein
MAQKASNFINLPMAAYNAYNAYRSNNAAPNAANGRIQGTTLSPQEIAKFNADLKKKYPDWFNKN